MIIERTPTSDEVLRRVGRNLVISQQIEHCLKVLLANHKYSGPIDEYAEKLETKTVRISKMMLGPLVEMYATSVLHDAGEKVLDEEKPANWFGFSFQINGETDFIEGIRRDLKLMTDERNELVHHFLPRWQPSNDEVLAEALVYLDAQRDRLLPAHEHLKAAVQRLHEVTKLVAEFTASPEYEKQVELLWVQASPLVALLGEVADQFHRQDGWTYLAQAGSLAARDLSDEVENLKERYGYKTLKKLLLGADIFDVWDEPLPGGKFRTLYRRKLDA